LTQQTEIFSFLLKNPNARPIEISKKLKIPAPSVRRAIFTLRKEKILSKPVITGKNKGTVKIRQTKKAKSFLELIKKVKPKPKEIEIEIEEEEEEEEFYTKILKTGASGKHDRNLVASTWENKKNPLRFKELKKALLDFADLNKIRTKDLGYENNKKLNEPSMIPKFPEIEVTTE
jgi:DNA-binding Lrp family transcriptional regulator